MYNQVKKQKSEIKEENEDSESDEEVAPEIWPTKCINYMVGF